VNDDGRSGTVTGALLAAALSALAAADSPTPRAHAAARAGAAPAVSADAGAPITGRARFLMGARLVIEARGAAAEPSIEMAFGEVARLESVLSNWRPDSEVSRLNGAAAAAPVTVSEDLYAAVGAALRWAESTDGAFDPTVEPLVRGLGLHGPEGILPGVGAPPAADAGTPRPVGWRGVRLDPGRRAVGFAAAGMGVDFGGIGKGMALDAAARVLREAGVEAALLDFAGQVLVFGRGPDAGGWRIGIADPDDRGAAVVVVDLPAGSLSTSGNAERGAGSGGRRVGHILDPHTGEPVAWNGSVTVLAADATAADALSTALFVLGPERGTAWAKEHGVQVLYLERDARGTLRRRGAGALFAGVARGTPASGVGRGARLAAVPPPQPQSTEGSR
jgi:thiamine biosynthesis lipoprotein